MTHVQNDANDFADEATSGLVGAYGDLLTRVTGGVVRRGITRAAKVAVVIGGGSGHYPAFAGWVGPGLADGAVIGNIFASPSTQQICAVAEAAEDGAGVFLSYGNYAGDVLNFSLAQERLRADGIATEQLAVTDDVSSADLTERHRRRGVAGDLVVFKIAGAAAEEGQDLAAVTAVARRANDATVSFGVAFAGCTLPGDDHPLFTVPDGQMGIGLGVHGEPGIAEEPIERAADLADRLVRRLLEERPVGSDRVAVVLNGLGATKYEELFVLFASAQTLLGAAGLTVVRPEVGELITSLDMAGVSLTLTWLDPELERLWSAPAHTPAFHRVDAVPMAARPEQVARAERSVIPQASEVSRAQASTLVTVLEQVTQTLHVHAGDLGDLDAIAGDGDHGRGMTTGADAALAAAQAAVGSGAGLATTLAAAGNAWADRAGGTSGALWGNALHAAAGELDDTAPADARTGLSAVRAAEDLVSTFGKAQPGDKTMVDALGPFVDALAEALGSGHVWVDAWTGAADTAESAAQATADLRPRIGRSRVLADRSVGHPDPGAISLALVLRTVGGV